MITGYWYCFTVVLDEFLDAVGERVLNLYSIFYHCIID